MPVANKQIEELYGIFRKYLSQTAMQNMLEELVTTEAYATNKSFAMTIDRLLAALPIVRNPADPTLTAGHRYKITHRAGNQQIARYSIMDYMGPDHDEPKNLNFSARPLAGTQSMPKSWIISIREVPKTTPIAINKIARLTV